MTSQTETPSREELSPKVQQDVLQAAHILGTVTGQLVPSTEILPAPTTVLGEPLAPLSDIHDCTRCAVVASCGLLNMMGTNDKLKARFESVAKLRASNPSALDSPNFETFIKNDMNSTSEKPASPSKTADFVVPSDSGMNEVPRKTSVEIKHTLSSPLSERTDFVAPHEAVPVQTSEFISGSLADIQTVPPIEMPTPQEPFQKVMKLADMPSGGKAEPAVTIQDTPTIRVEYDAAPVGVRIREEKTTQSPPTVRPEKQKDSVRSKKKLEIRKPSPKPKIESTPVDAHVLMEVRSTKSQSTVTPVPLQPSDQLQPVYRKPQITKPAIPESTTETRKDSQTSTVKVPPVPLEQASSVDDPLQRIHVTKNNSVLEPTPDQPSEKLNNDIVTQSVIDSDSRPDVLPEQSIVSSDIVIPLLVLDESIPSEQVLIQNIAIELPLDETTQEIPVIHTEEPNTSDLVSAVQTDLDIPEHNEDLSDIPEIIGAVPPTEFSVSAEFLEENFTVPEMPITTHPDELPLNMTESLVIADTFVEQISDTVAPDSIEPTTEIPEDPEPQFVESKIQIAEEIQIQFEETKPIDTTIPDKKITQISVYQYEQETIDDSSLEEFSLLAGEVLRCVDLLQQEWNKKEVAQQEFKNDPTPTDDLFVLVQWYLLAVLRIVSHTELFRVTSSRAEIAV